LSLEQLESRLTPTTFIWTGGGGANTAWSDGANWSGGSAPTGLAANLEDLVFPNLVGTGPVHSVNDLHSVNGGPATFDSLSFSGNNYSISGNSLVLGTASNSGSGSVTVGQSLTDETVSLNVQLGAAAGSDQFFTINPGATLTYSGQLSGSAGTTLAKEQTGTLILTNDNSALSGAVQIDSGVVEITNAKALGAVTSGATVAARSQLQVNNVVGGIAKPLTLNGAGVANDGALLNVAGNNTWAGSVTLGSDATLGCDAGSLNISGQISNPGQSSALTKTGAGLLQLSNDNTYSGTTTISQGTLLADGPNGANTIGAVSLNGGVLGGGATVGAVTATAAGGVVQPGDATLSPSTLTSATETWNSATTFFVALNPNGDGKSNQLVVNGDLNLNNASLSGFVGSRVAFGDTFTILTFTGTRTGTFAAPPNAPNTVFIGGSKFQVIYDANDVQLKKTGESALVTITSSANPAVFGQSPTFTATVSAQPPASGAPTGSVTFYIDGQAQSAATPLNPGGQAAISLNLSVGSHAISASYSGDGSFGPIAFNPSAPPLLSETVISGTQTSVSAAPASGDSFGQAVKLTAAVSAAAPGASAPITGSVMFSDGQQSLGVGVVSNGVASVTTTALPIGQNQTLTAVYSGDMNYAGSTGTLSYSVAPASTTTTVSASPAATLYGQAATFMATVTSTATGVAPTGIVGFYVDGGFVGQGTLNARGQASLSLSSIPVGQHSILAYYPGDGASFSPSLSSTAAVEKVQGNVSVSIKASTAVTLFGQAVTFTAAVTSPPGVAPTGIVGFYVDGGYVGQGTLNARGQASLSLSSLLVGSHSILAYYPGDGTFFFPALSPTAAVEKVQAYCVISVNGSTNFALYGQAVTFTATVASPPGVAPTGIVGFYVDGGFVGQGALNATGQARLSLSSLLVGSHSILAYYPGDGAFFFPALSPTAAVEKVQAYCVISVNGSTNFTLYGQPVTFTATVVPTAPGVAPTGIVAFFVDGDFVGLGMLNARGQASLSLSSLLVGPHSILAYYPGDGAFFFSALSPTAANVVIAAYSVTTLGASPSFATLGELVIFTARVVPTAPGVAPTGVVSFYVDNFLAATSALNGNGQAAFGVSSLSLGFHTITAVYWGDGDFFISQDTLSSFAVLARQT
jgi:autotransporter-associated beta strand protein